MGLVAGVGQFHNPPQSQIHADDAQAVADLLRDPTYGRFRADHVRLIAIPNHRGQHPRRASTGCAQLDRSDLAVIYIATHGTAREQDAAAPATWCLRHRRDSLDGLYSTAIPMEKAPPWSQPESRR